MNAERFWAKVDKAGPVPAHAPELGPCWEWTGARHPKGYGHFSVGGRTEAAHRVVYEDEVGPIPDGHEVDHLCRNTPCVRPSHLEAVTPAENMRRRRGTREFCPKGHEMTPENSQLSSGRRRWIMCRECRRKINREGERRRREERARK